MKGIFEGCATALITPFKGDGIDYAAMERIIEFQISQRVSALVVCGTTGEVSTLSVDERRELIKFTVEKCAGRVPVIAGTGGNNTVACVQMTEYARKAGADAILSVTPYYNKGTRDGILQHYKRIADCGLPMIIYNVPSRTGSGLTPADYERLSEIPEVCGIKEADSKPEMWLKTMRLCGDRLTLYSGNDSDTLMMLAIGARGVVSACSNVIPGRVSDMCRAYLEGDTIAARRICFECAELFEALFCQVNPVPLKYAMSRLGFCENTLRLPLTPLRSEFTERIDKILSDMGAV